MDKTMVVWRKLGREHDERGVLRRNRPAVVAAYVQEQVDECRRVPEDEWRWWRVDEQVVLERPLDDEALKPAGAPEWWPARAIYHLPKRGWTVVEDAMLRGFNWAHGWYVHVGDISYDPEYESWIFTDYFCDVIIREDGRTHSVMDLDDLGAAISMKLISPEQAANVLTRTQKLIDHVRMGGFPPREIVEVQEKLDALGWSQNNRDTES